MTARFDAFRQTAFSLAAALVVAAVMVGAAVPVSPIA
jgi:hypothetical protein